MNKTDEDNIIREAKLTQTALKREKWKRVKQMKLLYLVISLPLLSLFIFRYIPIYGIIIAFKDYEYYLGYWKSAWNNFEHFRRFFSTPFFGRILKNTVIISTLRIIFGFPAPIILALLICEIHNTGLKKIIQSISYLPHFMSWVVLAGIIVEILSPQRGIVGYIFILFGKNAPLLLTSNIFFRPMLIITGIWKGIGWGTIIYLAAISSINPELYEVAVIDGANRVQMAMAITLPSLIPVIIILFILRLGQILNAGFDQIFNLYNPVVYEVADIIDTYVYRVGIFLRKYDFATAVGLFKNVIGVFLIFGTNLIIRRFSEYGIW